LQRLRFVIQFLSLISEWFNTASGVDNPLSLSYVQVPIWDVPVYNKELDASSVLDRTSSCAEERSSEPCEGSPAGAAGKLADPGSFSGNDSARSPSIAGSNGKVLSGRFALGESALGEDITSVAAADSSAAGDVMTSAVATADSSTDGDFAMKHERLHASSNYRTMTSTASMCPLALCSS
jgi:hypothetical protein